jgi:hypothetical protein
MNLSFQGGDNPGRPRPPPSFEVYDRKTGAVGREQLPPFEQPGIADDVAPVDRVEQGTS